MNKAYIDPIYDKLEEDLEPFIEEYGIDRVSIRSLIRSSVEVQDTDYPQATIAVISRDCSTGKSIRLRNIKVNFSFAVNTIFSCKAIYDADGFWLLLALLRIVNMLWKEMSVELGSTEAIIVYCLHMLRCGDIQMIVQYANGEVLKESKNPISLAECEYALLKLERIGTVILENGKYKLTETIIFTK